ncbi:MAG: substrate-binding domain-containing protein [Bacteroidota bacterium]
MKKASLKDIAKLAGVSTSTVSFVLNGKADIMRISKPIAEKVAAIAKKSGYHPNQLAVSLRTGQSKIIGLLLEDISNNFFATLAKFIEDEANDCGYKVVYCSTENDSEKAKSLIQMLSHQQVDGFIIVPTDNIDKDIQQLIDYRRPVVLMDRFLPSINTPYVLVNNFEGIKTGTIHLIEKGYRKIGFVTVDLDMIQMQKREEAYMQTIHGHSKSIKRSFLLKLPYKESPTASIKKIRSFIRESSLDAIFFATNYLGLLGLESIKQSKLKIPTDLAVICFDDHDIFRLHTPEITAIRQPIKEIAKTAVQILLAQMENKKRPGKTQVEILPQLILRAST